VRRWVRGSQHLWHYHPDLSPQEHLFTNAQTRAILQQPAELVTRFFGLLCKYPIPRDDVVYTGPMDFAWSRDDSLELYLNARDLFRALFVGPVKADAVWDVQDEDAYYVVTVYEKDRVTRQIWIERRGFNVERETYYDGDGLAQLEIERKGFADLDGRLYPASLVLRDLISGSSVYLDFSRITLDPENVSEEAFRFQIPDDVNVRTIDTKKIQT